MLLVLILPSLSNAQVCFTNMTSARSALALVEYDLKTITYLGDRYSLCDAERINLSIQKESLNTEVQSLKSDKVTLNIVLGEYKDLYVNENAERLKLKASTPSRVTWFGVGAISAVVLGLIGIIAIRN